MDIIAFTRSKIGANDVPPFVRLKTPPFAVATKIALGWPATLATVKSSMRPLVLTGPMLRHLTEASSEESRRGVDWALAFATIAASAGTRGEKRAHMGQPRREGSEAAKIRPAIAAGNLESGSPTTEAKLREMSKPSKGPLKVSALRRVAAALGPGVITGAADDDPSGIATYSIAGAQFGTKFLWTAPVLWPLMAAVQMMCARIGLVTGRGLAGALRQKYPRWLLAAAAGALFIANTIIVGADLGGMADAAHLLTGVPSFVWVLACGIGIAIATIRLRYAAIANTLKWLALILAVYVVAAIDVHPDWGAVLRATVVPNLPHGRAAWATLVAILGTTISPYLFFWQASQEIEEEKAAGQLTIKAREGATATQIGDRKIDIGLGTLFSNIAMFFIIVTTASTLHAHGQTQLATSADVAAALRPLVGRFAMLLYTIGIVGTGLLAIPTLAGSAAYAFAETFNWRQGIDEKFTRARAFYAVIGISIAIGVAMDFVGISAVKALYWTAVINGLLAPFLMVGILHAASDRKLMCGQPSSWLGRVVVGLTTLAMFVAGIAMFVV